VKLQNSTDIPDHVLRRMTSWCCRELGLPAAQLRRIRFTNMTRGASRGRAWSSGRLLVRIGKESAFPTQDWQYGGATVKGYATRMEGLVSVTAHEVFHLVQWHDSARRPHARKEMGCVWGGNLLMEKFRAQRGELMAEWCRPVAVAERPQVSVLDRRALKAQSDLDRWTRKLKLAQTKVRKLRQRVHYYDGRQAAQEAS
jgi:hypothetical protein